MIRIGLSLVAAVCLVLAGCGNAVDTGHGTALSAVDLRAMTDRMAASILGNRRVEDAIAREHQLRVVVEPVENEMTAEILPLGEAQAFTARVRALLGQRDPNDFLWILNRRDFYGLRGKELGDLGPAPESVQPRYALTAHFQTLTTEDARVRSSYYLCVYELKNLDDGSVLWTDKYELEKKAVKGFLD